MPYSPFKIARFFIEKANQEGKDISPMKLIKLVYISHAWNLTFFESPLIAESIQAWKYGPVIESLYHGFKRYGNSSIPLKEAETLPVVDVGAPERSVMEKVWEKYGTLSAVHLSSLTHQPGTPWSQTWQDGGNTKWTVIPDAVIRTFYQKKLQSPAEAGIGH